MTGARTLIVSFDAELDGEFQRAFGAGLEALAIPYADAGSVDADPDSPQSIDIYLVAAARGGTGAYDPPDVVRIIGGPGARAGGGRALRLEAADIHGPTKHWAAAAERIGRLAGRPGLDVYVLAGSENERLAWAAEHPLDPLAADLLESRKSAVLLRQLEDATRRADEAEAALLQLQRDIDVSAVDRRRAESGAASSHARIVALEAEVARLRDQLEAAAFSLSLVPAGQRAVVEKARDAAGRARLAAAEAGAAAETYRGALVWPKGDADYSGETKNRHPHGSGAMAFAKSGAFYRGDFADGRREGFGVGRDVEGAVWAGQWSGNAACGFGVLETPDGRRFEGEVAPGEGGPRRIAGYVWPVAAGRVKAPREPIELRQEVSVRALPAK